MCFLIKDTLKEKYTGFHLENQNLTAQMEKMIWFQPHNPNPKEPRGAGLQYISHRFPLPEALHYTETTRNHYGSGTSKQA